MPKRSGCWSSWGLGCHEDFQAHGFRHALGYCDDSLVQDFVGVIGSLETCH